MQIAAVIGTPHMNSILTVYWIESPDVASPFGFGVTAFSVEDAFRLLRKAGINVPQDVSKYRVKENIKFADIDPHHIGPNMGPIVVRGVWYPYIPMEGV